MLLLKYSRLALLILVTVSSGSVVAEEEKVADDRQEEEVEFTTAGRNHFAEFRKIARFLQPLRDRVNGKKCKDQVSTFLEGLSNSSLWAMQMLDASAKLPQGLLSSDAFDLGNYDGCLEINLNRPEGDNIMGKYCLADFKISQSTCRDEPIDLIQRSQVFTLENLIVRHSQQAPLFRYGFKNNAFRLGMCVPHECTSDDVENLLRVLYSDVIKIKCKIDVWIPENACATAAETATPSSPATLTWKILLSLFVGVILATILEVSSITYKFKSTVRSLILPFSAYKNYKWLVSAHATERLAVVDSLKVYALILLTLVNRFHLLLRGPIANRRSVDRDFSGDFRSRVADVSNEFVAGTFLVVSGFLHYHRMYNLTRVNPSVPVGTWRIFFLQFYKMLPLYATAVIFYAFAYEPLGDGPLWKERTRPSVTTCRNTLLGSAFNLNKLAKLTETCISESWYFTVIAPHFLILPLIFGLMSKNSTLGSIVLGFLTGVALLMRPLTIYDSGALTGTTNAFSDAGRRHQLTSTAMNQTFAYFVGVASSASFNRVNGRKNRVFQIFSNSYILSWVISSAGIFLISQFVMSPPTSNFSTRHAIDVARQLTWSLIVSLLIVKVPASNKSYLSRILTIKYLSFFGSFTYPYVLILGLIQRYTAGTARTIDYFSLERLVWMTSADLVATFIFAFVFYMMLHRPVLTMLEDRLLRDSDETCGISRYSDVSSFLI